MKQKTMDMLEEITDEKELAFYLPDCKNTFPQITSTGETGGSLFNIKYSKP